jgi:Histidine kinase/Two component regulator propeller
LRKLIIIFLFIALGIKTYAQNLNLSFKQYTVNDGLASNEIYQIFKDKKGLLWFATDGGISKFDGKKFKNFNRNNGLKENTIFGFYEDFEGKIWYRGTNGLIGYIQHDSIFNLIISDTLKKITKRGFIQSIYLSKDKTLHLGLYHLDFPFITSKFPYNNYSQLLSVPVIQDSSMLYVNKIEGNYIHSIINGDSYSSIKYERSKTSVSCYLGICENDKFVNNKLLKLSNDSLASSFLYVNKMNTNFLIYKKNLINFRNNVSKLFPSVAISASQYVGDSYFITTGNNGIYIYNSISNKVDSITGVKKDVISCAIRDNENGLWYSSTNNGAFKSKDLRLQTLFTADKEIIDFKYLNKQLLVLFRNGNIKLLDRKSFKVLDAYVYGNKNSSTIPYLKELLKINDTTFTAGKDMFKIDGKRQIIRLLLQIPVAANSIAFQKDSNWLFGCNASFIYRCELSSKKYNPSNKKFPRASSLFYLNKDSILYTYNNGIGVLDENLDDRNRKDIEIAKDNSVFGIFKSDEQFIVITNNTGILILDRKFKLLRHIQNEQLLNKIRRANFDGKSLLINTNRGVLVFRDIMNSDAFHLFDSKSGLLNDETNAAALINDTLYVSTLEGLNYFNIDSVLNNQPKVPLYFDNFEIDNQVKYFSNDTLINLELPYETKSIKLNLLFPNFKNAEGRRYYYKLNKNDTGYIETAEDYILLDRLRSGKYEIEVFARTAEGNISKNKIHAHITIRKAFWETWWFYLLLFLSSFAIIYSGVYYWVKREEQKQKEKSDLLLQISALQAQALSLQMNPHFIFNAINSIQNFILKADVVHAYDYLTKFSQLIRKVLEASRKEVVTLGEELFIVNLNCELESLRFGKEFSFQMIIDKKLDLDATLLPSMSLQPYVENAIWHGLAKLSGAKALNINVSGLTDEVQIVIDDNGIGIDKSKKNTLEATPGGLKRESLAMKITDQRIQNFNTKYNTNMTIDIQDKSALGLSTSGTIVKIRIPIIK